MFICPITGTKFDSLVKVVSARYCQVSFSRGEEGNVVWQGAYFGRKEDLSPASCLQATWQVRENPSISEEGCKVVVLRGAPHSHLKWFLPDFLLVFLATILFFYCHCWILCVKDIKKKFISLGIGEERVCDLAFLFYLCLLTAFLLLLLW